MHAGDAGTQPGEPLPLAAAVPLHPAEPPVEGGGQLPRLQHVQGCVMGSLSFDIETVML